jgi:hypothetical protein
LDLLDTYTLIQPVNTIDYSAIADSHTLEFSIALTKSSQSAVFTGHCLATAPNNVLCFRVPQLRSLLPCSWRTALPSGLLKTVLLYPWPPSQGPGPSALRPTATELQTLNCNSLSSRLLQLNSTDGLTGFFIQPWHGPNRKRHLIGVVYGPLPSNG